MWEYGAWNSVAGRCLLGQWMGSRGQGAISSAAPPVRACGAFYVHLMLGAIAFSHGLVGES